MHIKHTVVDADRPLDGKCVSESVNDGIEIPKVS